MRATHAVSDSTAPRVDLRWRHQIEEEIKQRVEAERARLEASARAQVQRAQHFQRPPERPFTAAERDRVTILIGGLSWKHDALIKAAFQSAGYKVDVMPVPDVPAFQLGKEYGNNGQCNPTYFMIGHLIKYLQALEVQGLSRQHIIDNYVFFTAGSCGPCRFGMYESEYRLAVQNAGFDGFRVLLFQQTDGIKAASGEPGLKFTVDVGMGAFNALNYGDVLNDLTYQIRPFEANAGETDRVVQECMDYLTTRLRERQQFEILQRTPAWIASRLARKKALKDVLNSLGKVWDHLYGQQTLDTLHDVRDRLGAIEIDRLRVKPVVKVTGEFWAQTTEGDGNFRMFSFLEREGAQVMVEPIGTWAMYMLWLAAATFADRKGLKTPKRPAWAIHARLADELSFRLKLLQFDLGRRFYMHQHRRVVQEVGDLAHPLVRLDELARLAAPYYNVFAKGGEGHMEVAKNIYYTVTKKCHMVLSLKPFGCMPSSQSDGVQSAVMSHFKDMIFLPIETSGEGEINAHSRVQMALGEAKAKAKGEFKQALESTGKKLDDIKAFVAEHPELRRPFYKVPHRQGVTGTAATFVLHVSDVMDGKARVNWWPRTIRSKRSRVSLAGLSARRAS
ncbi:MAG: activator of (R)-2-hydroxyglutaryl-CoA dehydratase [Acidobacteria bacterium]|nr:activator of (R)-2-hydroxyglutaryl-CoA dehydratase [Acidobacteriota bacterium]